MTTGVLSRAGNSPSEGIKAPCVAIATSQITLTGEQVIDSLPVIAGDRVLVAGQTDAAENGIYVVSATAWSRAPDWNSDTDVINGMLVLETNGGNLYRSTIVGAFVLGTSEVSFDNIRIAPENIVPDTAFCPGYKWDRVSGTSITARAEYTGFDLTTIFTPGRRCRIDDGGVAKFGIIATSVHSGGTTLTFNMEDSATINANPIDVCLTSSDTVWQPVADSAFGTSPIEDITSGFIGTTKWWVIVGGGGKLATSTDKGVTWTLQTTPVTSDLTGVAYNPDLQSFIAVGVGGVCLRSTDGTTWSDVGNFSSLIGAEASRAKGIYWPGTGNWLIVFVTGSTTTRSAYADDGATLTWATGESSIPSAGAYWGMDLVYSTGSPFYAIVALSDDGIKLDNPQDVTSETRYTNVGGPTTEAAYFFHSPSAVDCVCMCTTNGIVKIYNNAGTLLSTDSTTFVGVGIHAAAYSSNLRTLVVVGAQGTIGYRYMPSVPTGDQAFTIVANGFEPDDVITCVHRDDAEGVFIACSATGVICRSTNGVL